MNAHGLADELNALLATENRSLSRHLQKATPHLSPKTYPVWQNMQGLSKASSDHAARLSQLILDFDIPARPRTFDPEVANYHFLDLEFLLPKLLEEKQHQIAAYDRALAHAGSREPLRSELASLKRENEEQLASLEKFMQVIA